MALVQMGVVPFTRAINFIQKATYANASLQTPCRLRGVGETNHLKVQVEKGKPNETNHSFWQDPRYHLFSGVQRTNPKSLCVGPLVAAQEEAAPQLGKPQRRGGSGVALGLGGGGVGGLGTGTIYIYIYIYVYIYILVYIYICIYIYTHNTSCHLLVLFGSLQANHKEGNTNRVLLPNMPCMAKQMGIEKLTEDYFSLACFWNRSVGKGRKKEPRLGHQGIIFSFSQTMDSGIYILILFGSGGWGAVGDLETEVQKVPTWQHVNNWYPRLEKSRP